MFTQLKSEQSKKNTIAEIVDNHLCIGCGACQGVCPFNAIRMEWGKELLLPKINNNCKRCSLCKTVCPGQEIDFNKLNLEFFGRIPKDIRIGNYLKIWAGYTNDGKLRYKAASGGLVSTLLIHALKEKVIDDAIILGTDPNNPLLSRAVIVKTKKELIESCGSNYLSGSICDLIPQLIKNKGKYAVVGQPCHLAALRKAELKIKSLREKIILHFGLFCQTKTTLKGLDFWLRVNKINKQDITKLSYRGNGWPGGMTINLKNGKNIFYPLPLYWQFLEKFSPKRCTLCPDSLAEFSDISFGDAWVSEFENDKKGTSIIIVRSLIGKDLLESAIQKNEVTGKEVSEDMLVKSQYVSLAFKKEQYYYRAQLLSFLGIKVPEFKGGFNQRGKGSYINALHYYLIRWFYHQEIFWPFIYWWRVKVMPFLKISPKRLRFYSISIFLKIFNPVIAIILKYIHLLLLQLVDSPKKYSKNIKRVLIINQADLLNKGDAAILTATEQIIQKAFPTAKIVVVSHTPDIDIIRSRQKVTPSYRFIKAGSNFLSLLRTISLGFFISLDRLVVIKKMVEVPLIKRYMSETLLEYSQADLVIHRGGDNLTEDYGIPYLYFESILISLLMNKPTVILGESIGPFNSKISRNYAQKILNRVNIIITREKLSIETLQQLGINKPKVITLPDVAFLLNASDKERLKTFLRIEKLTRLKKPIIAISISALIAKYAFYAVEAEKKNTQLISALVEAIDYLQKKYKATIVFIPHVVGKDNDDRIISSQILGKLQNKKDAYVINGEYSHEDYKAFLTKEADLFIGARMHANIAALTSYIPTVALSYSQKTQGIIGEMLGLSDFIIDIRQVKNGKDLYHQLISKTELLWRKRLETKKYLLKQMPKIQKKAQSYIKILKNEFS